MIWWDNKEKYEQFLYELSSYPNLDAIKKSGTVELNGNWEVFIEGTYIISYQIKIVISENYPTEVPKVYEIGGKILKIPDFHFNEEDQSACLFVQPARWEQWPIESGIKRFLDKPVTEFFFSQAYKKLKDKWPFGDSLHSDDGIIQYYLEKLELKGKTDLVPFLDFIKYTKPYRQWKCPCGNKLRYKNCHWNLMEPLIKMLPIEEWDYLKTLILSKSTR